MPTSIPQPVWSTREKALVFACLLLMGMVMWRSSLAMSPTYDEPAHIVSGMAYWQMHDTRLFPEHPPLAKMVAAAPVVLFAPRPDYSTNTFCGRAPCEWIFPQQYLSQTKDPARILALARWPMILVTLILGAMVYRVSRRLFGQAGATLSLLTYASSPFFLGYGALAITDILLAVFCLSSCEALANFDEATGMRSTCQFSAACTAACLTKFSAGLMLSVYLVTCVWKLRQNPSQTSIHKIATRFLLMVILTVSGITLFYVFFCDHTSSAVLLKERADSFQQSPHLAAWGRQVATWLDGHATIGKIINPLALYVIGLVCFFAWFDLPGYVLGTFHTSGVWYYFPTVFLFKTTPMFLLLLVVAALLWLQRKRNRNPLSEEPSVDGHERNLKSVLVMTLLVFTASSMASNINLGIRHFSVPILILHVLVGAVVPWISEVAVARSHSVLRIFWITVLVGATLTGVSAFPNYIAYFNFLRGDVPLQDIVNDSNLDWGQSLPAIEQFRAEHGITHLYVNSATMTEPNLYIQGAKPWICGEPVPKDAEWLAVSANYLTQGQPNCNYLFRLPFSIIGQGTTYIFQVRNRIQP